MTLDQQDHFRILVVDDDASIRRAHVRLLKGLGYEVDSAEDGVSALVMLRMGFDLILLDAEMPHVDGFDVARRIREDADHRHLPIMMVSGLVDLAHRRRAAAVGINDFISKPVDPGELELRTKWLVRLKRAQEVIERQRTNLDRDVGARTEALRRSLDELAEAERRTRLAHVDTVRRLMIAAEYKDADTAGHIDRIGGYSELVARELQLAPGAIELIRDAAPMHDVGKIGIPDRVLLKTGPLDEDEWIVMRSHTTIGEQILAGSDSDLLQMGERIAATHHEKWNGGGYPRGLAGDAIPIEGRICAAVDFFDALTMNRPYRAAVPVDQVIQMMHVEKGVHFDPDVFEAFLGVLAQMDHARAAKP